MQANIPGAIGKGLPLLFLHVRKLFKDDAQAGIVTQTRLIARKEIPVKGIEGARQLSGTLAVLIPAPLTVVTHLMNIRRA